MFLLPSVYHLFYLFKIQARAQAMIQQLQENYEQIEQSEIALESFRQLEMREDIAIQRRLQVHFDIRLIKHIRFMSKHSLNIPIT